MKTTIDFATTDDLEALADLLAELFTLESDFRPERNKQLRGLRLILDNPQIGRLFVLRIDEEVAGMANALITVSTAEGRSVVLLARRVIPGLRNQTGTPSTTWLALIKAVAVTPSLSPSSRTASLVITA